MQKIAIIIPCYNEEKRLEEHLIDELIAITDCDIYFANDGSKDNTLSLLKKISTKHPDRCSVIAFEKNQGKAATIFKTVTVLLEKDIYQFIGYFDADFSTPVTEVKRIIDQTHKHTEKQFFFGSRVMVLNSGIQRSTHRHIIGRIIITLINFRFKLGIYDTQCGAKLFSDKILRQSFQKPFVTSWLFDVEIFIRLKKENLLQFGKEIPIYDWRDVLGSKLGWKTAFKILKELYKLVKTY